MVLLGAGASMEARDESGERPPTGEELATKISEQFLGGRFADSPLSQVAEFAASEADPLEVQHFVRDLLQPFQPQASHNLMTTFRWRGIATTNYDLVVERAYERNSASAQNLLPFIHNSDRVDESMRADSVAYLKLHGCITRTSDLTCPLILTGDQYIEHRKHRELLFSRFTTWASLNEVVFIGNRLQDDDLRRILLELLNTLEARPRFYLVTPNMDAIEQRFWEQKRVTHLAGTFGDFVTALDAQVPSTFRGLRPSTASGAAAISERFISRDGTLSPATLEFLSNDVDYVNRVTATEGLAPEGFYRGCTTGWAPIAQNLDVKRRLSDALVSDHVIIDEGNTPPLQFVLVKAEAGAGKSVFLRRLAWDAAHEYNALCLFQSDSGRLDSSAIRELSRLCDERIYLFVEDAAVYSRQLEELLRNTDETTRLTVFAAARTNEWNSVSVALSSRVTDEQELHYLSEREIDHLLQLLERHNCLFKLADLSLEERRQQLVNIAGRQLLVALHEATYGKDFEEIIRDEYERITPLQAREIYLTVCTLFRFKVAVRAGIISRLYGITFEKFKEEFFSPLERVVIAREDKRSGDVTYRARHHHIAEIVFDIILREPERRFDECMKCLGLLDVAYSSDMDAFRRMTQSRDLLQLFPDHAHVQAIYDTAQKVSPDDGVLHHQMGLYEMNRPGGDLSQAQSLLDVAERFTSSLRGKDAILHSRAELSFKRAQQADTPLASDKYLKEAVDTCSRLRRHSPSTYAYHTMAKVEIYRLERELEAEEATDATLEAILREIESTIAEGLQAFPGDDYLLSAEARVATLLAQTERAERAMKQAFARNARNSYVAGMLAKLYDGQGRIDEAEQVLSQAVDADPTNRRMHYDLAKLKMEHHRASDEELKYHFRRSFSAPGDRNLDAQLLHARQVFLVDGARASKEWFSPLAAAEVASEKKNTILYSLSDRQFGRVVRKEAYYCLIEWEGTSDWVNCNYRNVESTVWDELRPGDRVEFELGFSMRGANATNIAIASH